MAYIKPQEKGSVSPAREREQERSANNQRTTMLSKVKTLKGYTLDSLDGEIGTVKEFYFDDNYWTIRYLVADTGNWPPGGRGSFRRQVLISPYALRAVNKREQNIAINLTKKQIEDSPSLDSDKPVSRQFEETYYAYYNWPMYWYGPFMWGLYPYIVRDSVKSDRSIDRSAEDEWDPHLRSTDEVSGYHIQATDGEIGNVEDFIVDDETWAIRYLVINTRNWWPGKVVLVSPKWIQRVSWDEQKVFVNLTREAIKQSPEFTEEGKVIVGFPRIDEQTLGKILRKVPQENAFHFYTAVDQPLGVSADSLLDFCEKIRSIDIRSIEFHMARGDFESWINYLGDIELAERLKLVKEANLTGETLREKLYAVLKSRYDELLGVAA